MYKHINFPDTVLDLVKRATKSERYFADNTWLPSDLPEQSECFIDIMVDQYSLRKNVTAWVYPGFSVYKRRFFDSAWEDDWIKNVTNLALKPSEITRISIDNEYFSAELKWLICNNICYVTLNGIKAKQITEVILVSDQMPKAHTEGHFDITHKATGNWFGAGWINENTTALYFRIMKIDEFGFVNFCYPIRID